MGPAKAVPLYGGFLRQKRYRFPDRFFGVGYAHFPVLGFNHD
jgi:hypothetical protein